MALSFLYLAFIKILQLVRLSRRDGDELAIEVVMLRHEVAVLRRQVVRPALRPSDRALLARLGRLLGRRRRRRCYVQPETLLRWHRELVRRKWTNARRPGRPGIPAGTVAIILRLAWENPSWGYRRIQGEMAIMGVVLAPASVWIILRRHGVDPSRMRTGPTWAASVVAGTIGAGRPPWLENAAGQVLAGVYQHPGISTAPDPQAGVSELSLTFDYNATQLQWLLLAPGLINWVTQDTHLGLYRNYRSEEHTSELQSLRHLVCR